MKNSGAQLIVNSLEMIGHRLSRAYKSGLNSPSADSIIKNTIDDITSTLNTYYDGDYSYFDK